MTILTDFGESDGYVGQMKGVMLGICSGLQMVDIGHDVPPQNIEAGAFLLESSWQAFPRGTVHVCVVDPGVGSSRRAIVVRCRGATFVGPDNGLFTPVMVEPFEVREIDSPVLRRVPTSATFHGRDVFAVAAAHLAAGFPFHRVGRPVEDPVRLDLQVPVNSDEGLVGRVVYVDRFGNGITNITAGMLHAVADPYVWADEKAVGRVRRTYSEVAVGELISVISSSGRLEIAVTNGSAADRGIGIGACVTVRSARSERQG